MSSIRGQRRIRPTSWNHRANLSACRCETSTRVSTRAAARAAEERQRATIARNSRAFDQCNQRTGVSPSRGLQRVETTGEVQRAALNACEHERSMRMSVLTTSRWRMRARAQDGVGRCWSRFPAALTSTSIATCLSVTLELLNRLISARDSSIFIGRWPQALREPRSLMHCAHRIKTLASASSTHASRG